MAMPTALEIVSLYLYGQKTLPTDIKTDTLIRPPGIGSAPATVDVNEFMTTGGGRFVKVENFNYVRNFLAAADYNGKTLPSGTYSVDDLLVAYGTPGNPLNGVYAAKQYYLGMGDPDYIDRAYVFGSSEFEINADARFIVHPNGNREVLNIAVVPRKDNFDYTSTDLAAQITNWLTVDRIDPSAIGRTVPIVFTGTIANKQDYVGEDWYAMELSNTLDRLGLNATKILAPTAVLDFAALMVQIAASGIIDYKDADGRFVYLDGAAPSNTRFGVRSCITTIPISKTRKLQNKGSDSGSGLALQQSQFPKYTSYKISSCSRKYPLACSQFQH